MTERQIEWFAVLDGGEDCVVAGISALRRFGLQGFAVDRVQRRSPSMRLAAALVDALENMQLPLRGCALLAAVVQQRLVRANEIRPLVVAARTLPHRSTYVAVAGGIEGGAHSLLEIDFRRLARLAGLRPPSGQSIRRDRLGRRRYADADFDALAVEVDGAVHLKPLNWWDDTWRLNEVLIDGKPILRFPSVGVYLRQDQVVDQLRRAGQRWIR